jgi:hypothetical protein
MEINESTQLSGTPVLVHPDLLNDPASKQGHLGIIASADLSRDDIYVSFPDGPVALYSTDALLVLKKPNDIYKDLLTRSKQIDPADFKTLLQINLLQEYGEAKSLKTAMELAIRNEPIRRASMISLQEKLSLMGYNQAAGDMQNIHQRRSR